MRGQDLLDQRGTGARHADNEDRRRILVAGPGNLVASKIDEISSRSERLFIFYSTCGRAT
jgi:hypothetical protein